MEKPRNRWVEEWVSPIIGLEVVAKRKIRPLQQSSPIIRPAV
jgi:hypothetical protein